MTVKVVALVDVKPTDVDAFITAARDCIVASRAEAGALRYDLWREAAGKGRFVFDELYLDDAAVTAHMATDHFKAFGAAIRDLIEAPPMVVVTQAIDASPQV